ncbi:hypothetical protein BPUTSESOX_1685 [uncultured Gammaproteobacteria bacterium]|nr:hypothetical protein [uncultured Gammaproteobacteria bacterium]VVH51199.1 hypothetical protein BPUTSESOX_1685 [uncultured Gammaproteobacteria bacterium]
MNSITKYSFTRAKSKSVIVSHLKTLVIHGIAGLTHSKTKNHIVRTKNHIVSHLKTLVIHGIAGLTHSKTKNHIVRTKNHIVRLINYCFYLKNITLKYLKYLKNYKEPSFY